MSSASEDQEKESLARLLRAGLPMPDDHDNFITRAEFVRELVHFEKSFDTRMQLEVTKIQKWIFGGILAFIVTVGGGGVGAYVSIMGELQKVAQVAKDANRANDRLDERSQWIIAKDQRDQGQDEALRRVLPDYKPSRPEQAPE